MTVQIQSFLVSAHFNELFDVIIMLFLHWKTSRSLVQAHTAKHGFWLGIQLTGNNLLFDFGKFLNLIVHFFKLII